MSVNSVTITVYNTSSIMLDRPRQKKWENPLIFEQIWKQNVAVNQSNYELWSQAWKFCATSLPSSLKQILVYVYVLLFNCHLQRKKYISIKNDSIWFSFFWMVMKEYCVYFFWIQSLVRNLCFLSTKFHCRMK